MAAVDIVNIQKFYESTCVLKNINLNIEKGEFVALVGPSGSGKSTLLRLIAGLETLSDGQILINDKCVNTIAPAKRNMAMVFQNYALYPHMTVFANMAYGLKMRGMNKIDINQRVMQASELLQISEYLDRKPSALSGGQRQRVAIGRAMVRSPAVFLFDEPLSNLDSKLKTEMRHEIKKLHIKLKSTCIYVTHDQIEAMTLASKVVVLNRGIIEQAESPHILYNKPKTIFVASFIGHHPINLIDATINNEKRCIDTSIGLTINLNERMHESIKTFNEIVIGIRPEHLSLTHKTKHHIDCHISFIDDMGSDKLVQLETKQGAHVLNVRVTDSDLTFTNESKVYIDLDKLHVFDKLSGTRIGAWDEAIAYNQKT